MTGEGTYEPDWSGWLLITEVTVEDAAALTLNRDPDKRFDWEKHASAAQRTEFDRRVRWLKKWPLKGMSVFCEPLAGYSWTVDLREVVHYAKKAGWELPASLMKLATVDETQGEQIEQPSSALSKCSEPAASRRQVRTQRKTDMYESWYQIALENGHKGDGTKRTREEIAKRVAADPRAKDPVTGNRPDFKSVKRRLDALYPGWAEKSWAEKSGRNSCSL